MREASSYDYTAQRRTSAFERAQREWCVLALVPVVN